MDIRLLKTFCEVAKLENITQAADLLNFTQPTVSAQIRALEEHLGVQLFERIGKKLYISEAGKQLIEPAEKMLRIYHETIRQLNDYSGVRRTRIGMSSSYINYVLSPALLQLQSDGAAGKFNVDICLNSKSVLNAIQHNDYDIGIVHDLITEKNLNTVMISAEELVWVGHQNLIKGRLCPEIDDYPIITFRQGCTFRALCDRSLEKRGLHWTFEYNDFEAVKNAMAEGLGIALLPRIVVQYLMSENNRVSMRPGESDFHIFDEVSNLEIPLYAVTHKDKCLSATVCLLLTLLQTGR